MPNLLPNNTPFQDFIIYGPIIHTKEGRRIVVLVHKDHTKKTTMSYARYLMCIHTSRWLEKEEQVDHIDGNKLNDVIANLQILTLAENNRKSIEERKVTQQIITLRCPTCGIIFYRKKWNTYLGKKGRFTTCSRKCGGWIRAMLQAHGETEDLLNRIASNIVGA